MKRYCKNIDICNMDFIVSCIYKYLKRKWNRKDVRRLFCKFSNYSYLEITGFVNNDRTRIHCIVLNIANYLSGKIRNKTLKLRPIQYFTKYDYMCKKERTIGVQSPLHQICDYIAIEGAKEMLMAKIGVFQCASLPNKGQCYGKRFIRRWIDRNEVKYFIKGDVVKCFPSIPQDKLIYFLERDIKNNTLIWLFKLLLSMFNGGLSIGSYLSQYLCNYYLSYAYHFASEKLFTVRRTKRGVVRKRLITHVLFYMDDFILTGKNKKFVKRAFLMLKKFLKEELLLDIKDFWKTNKLSNNEPIDMMGFVFRKNSTTIRTKIFLKTRRVFVKFWKRKININIARKIISAYSWYKHTNSWFIRRKLKIVEAVNICKNYISQYQKEENNGRIHYQTT